MAWQSTPLPVINLGRLSYGKALNIQQLCAKKLLSKIATGEDSIPHNTLLLVEHNPVYTLGIRTKDYSISDEAKLKALGAEFFKTDRGGLITFHGPGQLVAYPILHLKDFKLTMRSYIKNIEQTVISLCAKYGLSARTTEHTGVWIQDKKVAAIGVHGRRYVTTHGVAVNCNTDLTWYEHIVPCGINDSTLGVTSLSQQLSTDVTINDVTINDVIPNFVDVFCEQFNCTAEWNCNEFNETIS